MPEITWFDDIPTPVNFIDNDFTEEINEDYEDSDWWNDPNCVMSRHHY